MIPLIDSRIIKIHYKDILITKHGHCKHRISYLYPFKVNLYAFFFHKLKSPRLATFFSKIIYWISGNQEDYINFVCFKIGWHMVLLLFLRINYSQVLHRSRFLSSKFCSLDYGISLNVDPYSIHIPVDEGGDWDRIFHPFKGHNGAAVKMAECPARGEVGGAQETFTGKWLAYLSHQLYSRNWFPSSNM